MKKIIVGQDSPGYYKDTEHVVLHGIDNEGVAIHFTRQIDDLVINSQDGDLLVSWNFDSEAEFPVEACMLLTVRDNLKELGNLKTTTLAIRSKEEGKILDTVYITVQRN